MKNEEWRAKKKKEKDKKRSVKKQKWMVKYEKLNLKCEEWRVTSEKWEVMSGRTEVAAGIAMEIRMASKQRMYIEKGWWWWWVVVMVKLPVSHPHKYKLPITEGPYYRNNVVTSTTLPLSSTQKFLNLKQLQPLNFPLPRNCPERRRKVITHSASPSTTIFPCMHVKMYEEDIHVRRACPETGNGSTAK